MCACASRISGAADMILSTADAMPRGGKHSARQEAPRSVHASPRWRAWAATAVRRDRRLLRIAAARAQASPANCARWTQQRGASSRGESARTGRSVPACGLRPRNPWQTLRANLKISSVAMRHAIRCATCLGLAVACERTLAIPHGAWIPMTVAIVLKPDFGGTLRFGLLRVAGTLAGLLLTTLIVHYATDGVVPTLLLMTLLCLAFRLLVQVNYGIGVAMLRVCDADVVEGIPGDAIRCTARTSRQRAGMLV